MNHLKELPEELYSAAVQSVFPSIADALAHIYRVDTTWFGAVSGKSFDAMMEDIKQATEQAKGVSLETMQELYNQLAEKYRTFLAEQDLDAVREYPHPQYGTLRASHSDMSSTMVRITAAILPRCSASWAIRAFRRTMCFICMQFSRKKK